MSFFAARIVAILVCCTLAQEPTCDAGEKCAPDHISLLQTSASLNQHQALRVHQHKRQDPPTYGNSSCPCIGIDVLTGTTKALIGGSQVDYPADLGARCSAWDDGRYPGSCENSGQSPGEGGGWCADQWCYVDPCNCDLEDIPKKATYIPSAKFQGVSVYYSYATCNAQDSWTASNSDTACVNQESESDCTALLDSDGDVKCAWSEGVCGGKDAMTDCSARTIDASIWGNSSCQCIGIDNQPGTTDVLAGGGGATAYPADVGASCKAWDDNNSPYCKGGDKPGWCGQSWCYVDPCSCGLEIPPKTSSYAPEAKFQGRPIYYSYATCGGSDTWTAVNHDTACVNQESETACSSLDKCAWTGTQCLGSEAAGACTA